MPIVPGSEPSPYDDTPSPKLFSTVSPLDPQLFSTIAEHAQNLLTGNPGAKYSPVDVAQWLDRFAAASEQSLAAANRQTPRKTPAFRRMEEDVLILSALGRFFSAKMRSALLFEIHQQTGSPEAGRQALAEYQKARAAWATMAERANAVYVSDISYGEIPMRRGHWSDRLPAIDRDLAAMEAALQSPAGAPKQDAAQAIHVILQPSPRPEIPCTHTAPESFHPGQPLALSLQIPPAAKEISAVLHYRHVNQGERWQTLPMQPDRQTYRAAIPAAYTASVYPLQYYFELTLQTGAASLWPGFNQTLSSQPYFAVWKRTL
jgi:hypothetical protein